MTESSPEPDSASPRPTWRRLLHASIETLIGLLLAAGLFAGTAVVLCGSGSQCDGFGGIVFYIVGFVVAVLGLGAFVTLCRRSRFRLRAREWVDTAGGALTIAIWIAVYLSDSPYSVF